MGRSERRVQISLQVAADSGRVVGSCLAVKGCNRHEAVEFLLKVVRGLSQKGEGSKRSQRTRERANLRKALREGFGDE